MSLRVDDGRSRGRSKSPGRRDERSHSRDIRASSPAAKSKSKKSSKYYSSDSDSDTRSRKKSSKKLYDDSDSDSDSRHKSKKSSKKRDESSSDSESDHRSKKKSSRKKHSDSDSDEKHKKKHSKKYYDSDSGSASSDSDDDRRSKHKNSKSNRDSDSKHRRASPPDSHPKVVSRTTSKSEYERDSRERHGSYDSEHTRPGDYQRHMSSSSIERDAVYQPMPGQYVQSQGQVVVRPEGHRSHSGGSVSSQGPAYATVEPYKYSQNGGHRLSYSSQPQYVEARPHVHATNSAPQIQRLSISGGAPGGLMVAGGLMAPGSRHGSMSQGGLPPGSPLLEAYRGTYQSISPMPSPLMLASKDDSDLSDIDPLDGDFSDDSRGKTSKSKKHVSIYNPEADALALASALKHSTPDPKPLLKILPGLSDDHVLMLRTEYKKHMKAAGKGVNIAKHIKMKVTGSFGKVAYAVALGRWESEAHWANFWYQSNTSRRELLIESLMGRTNSEIVKIKDAFSDQRYNNSLEKCMQTELKKDKFRNAVLLALEERRMDEGDKLSVELVRRDAKHLYEALTAKEGGETAMINIIVVRSNKHLAEVLRAFEAQYRKNFAREMIQKSKNLVGETLAHILNGVLNRPVRDALLVHQALAETSKDRSDLLVSRLVRLHWEPRHLEKVKIAFKSKYGVKMETAVQEGTKGDFGDFCRRLTWGDEK